MSQMTDDQAAPLIDAFLARTKPALWPFGMQVRRKPVPMEPSDTEVGSVVSTNLAGDKVFVKFGRGKMGLIAADDLEPAREAPIRARERKAR
jgi:hypothetical protein